VPGPSFISLLNQPTNYYFGSSVTLSSIYILDISSIKPSSATYPLTAINRTSSPIRQFENTRSTHVSSIRFTRAVTRLVIQLPFVQTEPSALLPTNCRTATLFFLFFSHAPSLSLLRPLPCFDAREHSPASTYFFFFHTSDTWNG